MEQRKLLAGDHIPSFDFTTTLPVAFRSADLTSLAGFAADFSPNSFPTYNFEPVLPGSVNAGLSLHCVKEQDQLSWPPPSAFPPTTSQSASQLLCSLYVSPGSDFSSDLSFAPSQDMLGSGQQSPSGEKVSYSLAAGLGDVASMTSKSAGGKAKKKKRKPKPRMAELSESEAQAKRDSNRESARKSRDRKRAREKNALDENMQLRKEVAELKLKVKVLSELLLEKGKML